MLIAPTDPTGLDLIISINQDRRQVGDIRVAPLVGGKDILMNSELYHYGVKGMKWGVRRYQNADGTLTQKRKGPSGQINQEGSEEVGQEHEKALGRRV